MKAVRTSPLNLALVAVHTSGIHAGKLSNRGTHRGIAPDRSPDGAVFGTAIVSWIAESILGHSSAAWRENLGQPLIPRGDSLIHMPRPNGQHSPAHTSGRWCGFKVLISKCRFTKEWGTQRSFFFIRRSCAGLRHDKETR